MAKAGLTVRLSSIVALLSPAIGREQSQELVAKAASRFDIASEELELDQALRVVDALGEQQGIVGVSARFARARLVHRDVTRGPAKLSSRPPLRFSIAAGASPRAEPPRPSGWSLADVVRLLAPSLGRERATEVVDEATAQLHLAAPFEQSQVTAVLEHLSRRGDVVGVVARFASSRLVLSQRG